MSHAITILGSSSALPTSQRFPTAQILQMFGRFFLIDCGEGTQMQLRRLKIPFSKIQAIFISHLHGDHYLGIFGVLSSFNLLGRTTPLTIYCPKDLQKIIEFQFLDYSFRFELQFVIIPNESHVEIFTDKKISVTAHKVSHRIPCWAFEFREINQVRNMRKDAVSEFNLGISQIAKAKAGSDLVLDNDVVLLNESITYIPPLVSYVYITDTRYMPALTEHIHEPTILYHEATFGADMKKRAKETYHSTSDQAALFAKSVGAKKLIIGHFSARYKQLDSLLFEAREVFQETYLAEDLKTFKF